jgi:hypothetical protein
VGVACLMLAYALFRWRRRRERTGQYLNEPAPIDKRSWPLLPILAAVRLGKVPEGRTSQIAPEPHDEPNQMIEHAAEPPAQSTVPALGRVPTASDLEELGRQAEILVEQQCSYVRLKMAKRLIVLLAPVQFFGSKHVGGVDVFLDPDRAARICQDVATALVICNDLLAEMRCGAYTCTELPTLVPEEAQTQDARMLAHTAIAQCDPPLKESHASGFCLPALVAADLSHLD